MGFKRLSSIFRAMNDDQIELLLRKIEEMNVRLDLIESKLDLDMKFYRNINRSPMGYVKIRSFVGALLRRNHYLNKLLLELRDKRR